MGTIRRLLGTTGSEIAETAVVLPLLFTILLGIFFFGRAYNIYGTITQAAMQGARAAIAPQCATNSVAPVLQASHLDPALVQSLTPSTVPLVCGLGTPATCDPLGVSATP